MLQLMNLKLYFSLKKKTLFIFPIYLFYFTHHNYFTAILSTLITQNYLYTYTYVYLNVVNIFFCVSTKCKGRKLFWCGSFICEQSHTHHHKCSNTVSYTRIYMSDKQWALNKQNIFSSLFTCTAHSAYNLKYMCSYAWMR